MSYHAMKCRILTVHNLEGNIAHMHAYSQLDQYFTANTGWVLAL